MEALENICACLPEEISRAVRERADSLTELRLRPGGRPQLCFADGDALLKAPLAPEAFREVAARMLEHSLYAWEDELKQGFFTHFLQVSPHDFSVRAHCERGAARG